MKSIRSLLIANRSEISIRVMRAASEMGIRTVLIWSREDRFALHRFKADESYMVGEGKKPLQAYLDIPDVIRIARQARVDAIHPGYGFLSENRDFARDCAAAGIIFVGPTPEVMMTLGNKVAARNAAVAAGVPVMPATGPLPREIEAGAAFGNDEVYLEKLVRRAHHVEVQITQASGHPVSAEASVKALEMLTATGSSFTASMLRDMLDGQRTEHDHILGMYRLLLDGSMA